MTPEEIIKSATEKGVRIAAAESCTGGMLFAELTRIPGASRVLDRGFITYSNQSKIDVLQVPTEMIETYGAVSPEVAGAMAKGALKAASATLAIGITGVAGPGGTPAKPEGMVCIALARLGGPVLTETMNFGAIGREAVRRASVEHACRRLMAALSAPDGGT